MAVDVDLIDDEHSERGPSTAHRWRPCPGSVRKSRGLPDTAGTEAAFGTVFHDFAATCVEVGIDPQGFVGDTMYVEGFGHIEFDQAMADNMLNGLDYLWAAADSPGAKMIVEKRVSLERWVGPGEFGTTDAAICDPIRWRMIGFDWKYGQGVPVSPERNDQAILYLLGAWSSFARDMFAQFLVDQEEETEGPRPIQPGRTYLTLDNIDDERPGWEDDIAVTIVIEQPRAPGGGGVWETNLGWLLREGAKIRRDADLTLEPDAPIVPGEKQCKFCAAAKFNTCKERVKNLLESVGGDFDDLEDDFIAEEPMNLFDKRALSPEARSQLLLHSDQIKKMLEELHLEAYRDAESGRPVPGMKLVDGRNPPRKWLQPKMAEVIVEHEFGADKAFTKKLLSPTQVEEVVGKRVYRERFQRMVNKGQSKPQLVPDTDKRDPIPNVASDFDELVDETENYESLV